jgi:hypothetical protein
MQPSRRICVACEIILPFPEICVHGFLLFKKVVSLVKKLYEKYLLNILCNFSTDFTQHNINNLQNYGITITPQLYKIWIYSPSSCWFLSTINLTIFNLSKCFEILWAQLSSMCLCFTDLTTAGYLYWYTGKNYFIMQPAGIHLRYNAAS